MKYKKTTISDIAKSMNVSSITVSRALRGEDGVSKELRDKIIYKAKTLGYHKPKNNVNILILHEKTNLQDNPNFNLTLQCMETELQKRGAEYSIEFIPKDKQNRKEIPCKILKGNVFDGILFIGRFNIDYMNFLKSKVECQVLYGNYLPSLECDTVRFNAVNLGYKQCKYLLLNGHKNIGFAGNLSFYTLNEKILGMQAAMDEYGLKVNKNFFVNSKSNDLEKNLLKMLSLKNKPTAIICQGDLTAMKIIKLLHENNFKVPDDVSIIGKGNQEVCAISIPALTTIDINIEYSCKSIIDLIINRINNPKKPYENITINGFLVERDSVKKLTNGGLI
ncbi:MULTISPECIES: LacI family DNA-binding transcriptional regulator [Clostridium]|uniref:LacI family DNA-binding transcriptional regulator n=1 Tax=Clostridium TaxID=1485 RepID=UPI000826BDE9|nr:MULTISPECIES: LacI family DNA-binding transcriptional regulator [Clostridium]